MDINNEIKSEDMSATQKARRKFLGTAGKLAIYTPPVMMGLLMPGEHAIASGSPSWSKGWGKGGNPGNPGKHGR